jgi:hypothetical protein
MASRTILSIPTLGRYRFKDSKKCLLHGSCVSTLIMAGRYLPQSLGGNLILLTAFVTLVYVAHKLVTRDRVTPAGLPWAGIRNESFARIRLNLRDFLAGGAHLKEGYEKVIRAVVFSSTIV